MGILTQVLTMQNDYEAQRLENIQKLLVRHKEGGERLLYRYAMAIR